MSKNNKIIIIVCLVLIIVAGGWWSYGKNAGRSDQKAKEKIAEFEEMVKKLRKGYLRFDQVYHEMSPEYQKVMISVTNRFSEEELFEKFSPGTVEWILDERKKHNTAIENK